MLLDLESREGSLSIILLSISMIKGIHLDGFAKYPPNVVTSWQPLNGGFLLV